MCSLYRRLRDRVEGSGSTHGGKRPQNGKRLRTAVAPKSDAGGQGMADALAEMTKR
jgi:Wiskott-Aldrich syndrome protein